MYGLQTERRTALILRHKWPIWSLVLLAGWLVWLLDVATKSLALHYLSGKEPVRIVGTFLQLTLTKNSGAAFNLATGGTVFLTTFGFAVILFIAYWAKRLTSRKWGVTLGLVLGGTLGNLTDRTFRGGAGAFRGEVIDWIALPHWPIFNVADSAIVIAALLAVVLALGNIAPISPSGESKEDSSGT
jgi:signal peptidase II